MVFRITLLLFAFFFTGIGAAPAMGVFVNSLFLGSTETGFVFGARVTGFGGAIGRGFSFPSSISSIWKNESFKTKIKFRKFQNWFFFNFSKFKIWIF